MHYTLTATLDGKIERRRFTAIDSMDASFEAIHRILDAAYSNPQGPWGRGEIVLTAPDGEVLQTMPAK